MPYCPHLQGEPPDLQLKRTTAKSLLFLPEGGTDLGTIMEEEDNDEEGNDEEKKKGQKNKSPERKKK
eukprot:scaffold7949_cov37-Cyclotella_meneghiniana.AAC.6